ncbi:Lon protease 2 [compost metagenome]
MPVGGIKEKVIAAHRAGVEDIILCKKNEKDLKEIPEEIRKDLTFHFVEDVNEVIKVALGVELPPQTHLQLAPPPQGKTASL